MRRHNGAGSRRTSTAMAPPPQQQHAAPSLSSVLRNLTGRNRSASSVNVGSLSSLSLTPSSNAARSPSADKLAPPPLQRGESTDADVGTMLGLLAHPSGAPIDRLRKLESLLTSPTPPANLPTPQELVAVLAPYLQFPAPPAAQLPTLRCLNAYFSALGAASDDIGPIERVQVYALLSGLPDPEPGPAALEDLSTRVTLLRWVGADLPPLEGAPRPRDVLARWAGMLAHLRNAPPSSSPACLREQASSVLGQALELLCLPPLHGQEAGEVVRVLAGLVSEAVQEDWRRLPDRREDEEEEEEEPPTPRSLSLSHSPLSRASAPAVPAPLHALPLSFLLILLPSCPLRSLPQALITLLPLLVFPPAPAQLPPLTTAVEDTEHMGEEGRVWEALRGALLGAHGVGTFRLLRAVVAGSPEDPVSPTALALTPTPIPAAPSMPTTAQDAPDIPPSLAAQTQAGALRAIRLALRHVSSDRLSSMLVADAVADSYGHSGVGFGGGRGGEEVRLAMERQGRVAVRVGEASGLAGVGWGDVGAYVVRGLTSSSAPEGNLIPASGRQRTASGESSSTADGLDDAERTRLEDVKLAEALGMVRDWVEEGATGGRVTPVRTVVQLAVSWIRRQRGADGQPVQLDLEHLPAPGSHPVLANLAAVLSHLLSPPPGASSAHRHAVTHHLLPDLLPELLPLGAHLSPRSAGTIIDQFERLHLLLPVVPDWERNITGLAEAFFTSSAPSLSTPILSASGAAEPSPRVRVAKLLLSTTFHALLDLPPYLARLLRVLLPNVLGSVAGEEDVEVWRLELEFLKECVVLLVGEEEEVREEAERADEEAREKAERAEEAERERKRMEEEERHEEERSHMEEMVRDMERPDGVDLEGEAGGETEEEDEATPTLTGAPAQRAALLPQPAGPAQATTKQPEPEGARAADAERHARILAIRQCLREVGACTCPDIIGSPTLPGTGQQTDFAQTPSKAKSTRPPFMGLISNVLGSGSRDREKPMLDDTGSPAPASGVTSAARSPLTSALPSPARGVLGSTSVSLLGGLSVPASPVVPSTPGVGSDPASPFGVQSPNPSSSTSTPLTGVTVHAHHAEYCRSKCAVLTLISLFTSLAFSPPHTLHSKSRSPRAPASAHSIEIFRDILDLLLSRSTCQRARLTALKWLMRLRADRDHRLFVRKDIDAEVLPFAVLIGRTEESRRALEASADNEDIAAAVPSTPDIAQDDRDRPRNRSGREERSSRSTSVERSRSSRSRSRQPQGERRPREPASPPPAQPIWSLPEDLPFVLEIGTRPSEGMTTYELGIISRMEEGDPHETELIANTARHWLPVSVYLSTLISLLRSETDWELVSYILVHFTAQLANKHLFCGPKLRKIIPELVVVVTQSVGSTSPIDRITKAKGIKNTDVHGLIYNLVGILIGYKGTLERKEQDAIVDVLQEGLTRDSATAKPCLQALAIACFELPLSMTRSLPKILPKLTQIMSASATSVHIIELICVIGSLPQLYSNFTREDYQRVFGVAVQYIQYHNSAQATETGFSYSLSQHILQLAYYSIYVWFLSIPLLERPQHIPYIARGLQLATQNKGGMDEQTEVCFDWLARYTWANADPKPHRSFLTEVIMRHDNEPDTQIEEKHYLQGHSIITIRTVMKRGWSEVISQRPSGTTQIICKLENLPTTGPGEFAPDPVTAQALVMADRNRGVVGKGRPNEPITLDDGTVIYRHTEDEAAKAHQEALDLFSWTPRGSDGGMRPLDAMTGYVWGGSAPSQRRKQVSVHPSFLPTVIGPFPGVTTPSTAFMPLPASEVLARTLRLMNSTAVIDVHKIGILYVGPGQTTETEILGNQNGSPGYTSFLVNMGRLIRLKGQRDVYSGGLDLENDLDGEYAYAWWDDIAQVIYHAATLMPNYEHDTQFNFKKRHIGNDNIRIVWNDSGVPYKFDTLRTEFQFVNIVIEPHSVGSLAAYSLGSHADEYYKLTMQRAPGMPEFGPTGTLKIVSAKNLPSVVRQISLLADFFTTIWTFTAGDRRRDEWVSSWRGRLQAIKRLQVHVQSTRSADTSGGAPAEMDFSLAY
ncbi:hypothetical protein CALVIDRAFT_602121, partial [Calocera viscosa TUFC12733]